MCGSPHPRSLCQWWLGKAKLLVSVLQQTSSSSETSSCSAFSIQKVFAKHAAGVFVDFARNIFGFKTVVQAGSATKSKTNDPLSTVVYGVYV